MTLEIVKAGLHCSFRMSRHILPLLFIFGWKTFVLNATCKDPTKNNIKKYVCPNWGKITSQIYTTAMTNGTGICMWSHYTSHLSSKWSYKKKWKKTITNRAESQNQTIYAQELVQIISPHNWPWHTIYFKANHLIEYSNKLSLKWKVQQ